MNAEQCFGRDKYVFLLGWFHSHSFSFDFFSLSLSSFERTRKHTQAYIRDVERFCFKLFNSMRLEREEKRRKICRETICIYSARKNYLQWALVHAFRWWDILCYTHEVYQCKCKLCNWHTIAPLFGLTQFDFVDCISTVRCDFFRSSLSFFGVFLLLL